MMVFNTSASYIQKKNGFMKLTPGEVVFLQDFLFGNF